MSMEAVIDFGNLLNGMQRLPEREKIILVALINAHGSPQNGDPGKIERMVAESIIAAARENQRETHTQASVSTVAAPIAAAGKR